MNEETFLRQKPFAGEKKPSMLRRCVNHDYTRRGVYLLTMVTEGRRPLFATVSGSSAAPCVELTALGQRVSDEWWNIPQYHPEVEIFSLQMMPDHLHGIIFVREQMACDLSRIVRGFKTGCGRHYRRLFPACSPLPTFVAPPDPPTFVATQSQHTRAKRNSHPAHGLLFAPGFNDRILKEKGQLEHWKAYLRDNPRRLLMKREHPDLFRLHRRTEAAGLLFTSMGNHFLLNRPGGETVEMSRSATDGQIQERLRSALASANEGAVTYTAAISKGEQTIARSLRQQGCPLVVLLNDGFPEEGHPSERYYKPGGVYFEACSEGRLLLLEPTEEAFLDASIQKAVEETLRRKAAERHYAYSPLPVTSQRYRFMALNEMARRLCLLST